MLSTLTRILSRRADRLRRSIVKRRHIAPMLRTVPHDAVVLEIGGGYNPRYRKAELPNVYHLDHASTTDLRAKYAADPTVAHLVDNIQPIDFVFDGRPIHELVPAALRFDLIYGSHVIEHQVDLVGHVQSLAHLLKPGGRVIEMIPDLRTTFDALRFPTVTSDVLLVHDRRPAIHQGKQLFDGTARVIDKNLGHRMRKADFEDVGFCHPIDQARSAMLAAEAADAPYADTHAWTFTPESFQLLMIELRLLRLVRLAPTFVSPTYGNQFCTVLEVIEDPIDGPDGPARESLERRRMALSRALRCR